MTQKELVSAILDKVSGVNDIDWSELAEISGMRIHPDQLRKIGQGIKLAADAGMQSAHGAPVTQTDAYASQKIRDLRNELNAAYRADARSSALRDAVVEAARNMPSIEIREPRLRYAGNGKQSLVLAVGDFHFGAEWAIKGLLGETINEYNPEIFETRMWILLDETVRILQKEDIGHVELLMCGDSLDGILRNSQLMKLRWGVVESVMRLSEFMAQWIEQLSITASVSVYNVDGNHGEIRPLGSRKGEFENENLEKILAWYLAARFEDSDTVYIDPVSEKRKLVEVQDYRILLTHGDDAKSLDALAKQTVLQYDKRIDYFICAHRHREQEAVTGYTDDGNAVVIRVPGICGADGYAQKLGYGGRPGALAMVIERGYGRRCVYPIAL